MLSRRCTLLVLVLSGIGCIGLPFGHAGPAPATVRGRILQFYSLPLRNVQLWLFSEPDAKRRFYARTDADGRFLLQRVPPGDYSLSVVRIERADDFSVGHIHIAAGDIWELQYNLQHRSVRLRNDARHTVRKFEYHGGTPDQLALGSWEEFH